MPEFLNREKLVSAIVDILREATNEVVMVVPFIKVSPDIWNELLEAESRGIEILIIYREDSMPANEKKKLLSLSNLTLMSHENVHAKCYFNESKMVIGSMNLYEYSQLNNREMGILIVEEVDTKVYDEAVNEITTIFRTSTLERKSKTHSESGLKLALLTSKSEHLFPFLQLVRRVFENKQFETHEVPGSNPDICCANYLEKVGVWIEYEVENDEASTSLVVTPRRFQVKFNYDLPFLKQIHQTYWANYPWEDYQNYKIYWKSERNTLSLYADRNEEAWQDASPEEMLQLFKLGMELLTTRFKESMKQVKQGNSSGFGH